MTAPSAILIVGLTAIAAAGWLARYDTHVVAGEPLAFVVDRFTGTRWFCDPGYCNRLRDERPPFTPATAAPTPGSGTPMFGDRGTLVVPQPTPALPPGFVLDQP